MTAKKVASEEQPFLDAKTIMAVMPLLTKVGPVLHAALMTYLENGKQRPPTQQQEEIIGWVKAAGAAKAAGNDHLYEQCMKNAEAIAEGKTNG